MGKILVTGAGGRLGLLVCSALLSEGYFVRGVVKPGSKAPLPPGAERFEADLSKPVQSEAFQEVSHIVHCAGLVGDKPFGELLMHNGFAVKNLLESCPSRVERVVLASSISVYGNHSGKVADESFLLKPDTPYGKSKLVAEAAAMAFAYQHKMDISLLRFGMIYGSSFTEGYYQVLKLLLRGKMRIIGKGDNRIPLLHQADAVSAIFAALGSSLPGCRAYNIVGAEQKTQKELLSIAASKLGVSAPTKSIPVVIAYA
ncbi:MAG: NAD(P)-dependent oxidoreductase, partial [Candidatus Anstonellaceae archaeon]